MFTLRMPESGELEPLRQLCSSLPFSYAAVSCSRTTPPAGFVVDHHRVRLGAGPQVFERAVQAFRDWHMFRLGWLEPCWPDARIEEGALVGTQARVLGLWCVNVCRIVYVVDEPERSFGFAYGTLPGHVERGEERFLVERVDDDSVWYDVLAYSRPGKLLTWLGYPLVRHLQRRFARDSLQAIARGCFTQGEPGASSSKRRAGWR